MDQLSSFLENILPIENDQQMEDNVTSTTLHHSNQSIDVNSEAIKSEKSDKSKGINSILADKLMESLVNMIIPVNNLANQHIINQRLEIQKTRPPLSVQIMSTNSIQLNSRLTNAFIFIDGVIGFFNWTNPSLTIGVMLILTLVVLQPILLTILPIILIINNVMIPHYMMIYEPDTVHFNDPYPSDQALNKPILPSPVPQFSQEFLLNFTDLQNHMIYYVVMYDFILWLTKDYLYFKNEDLSSLVYLGCFWAMAVNLYLFPTLFQFIILHPMILKSVILCGIWVGIFISYPSNREIFLSFIFRESTRIRVLQKVNSIETLLVESILVKTEDEQITPLLKEVEIFELQKFNKLIQSWELIGFTNDFYSINHPLRKLNSNLFKDDEDGEFLEEEDNISICRCFKLSDVKCIKGYDFYTAWKIDLSPRKWVIDTLIMDLVNIDDDEKWVYDFYNLESEIFRRRRWIRYAKRVSLMNST